MIPITHEAESWLLFSSANGGTKTMSAESGWVGSAIGISVGILAWVVGLGKILWAAHPQWALLLIVLLVSIVSMALLDRKERGSRRVHN